MALLNKFVCVVRGYHHYKRAWHPFIGEELTTEHDKKNQYDKNAISIFTFSGEACRYALQSLSALSVDIKVVGDIKVKVGYLPREISKECCKFIAKGGLITGVVVDNVRHSDVTGKGLEVPCELTFQHSDKKRIETVMKNVSKKYTFVLASVPKLILVLEKATPVLNTSGTLYETFGSRIGRPSTSNAVEAKDETIIQQPPRHKRKRIPTDNKTGMKKTKRLRTEESLQVKKEEKEDC